MDEKLNQAMQVFKSHFLPAETATVADETLTTQEILDKFQALLGEDSINVGKLTDLLIENNYKFDYILDEFLWLLKIAK